MNKETKFVQEEKANVNWLMNKLRAVEAERDKLVDRINRLEETNVCLRIKLQAVKIYVPNEVYIKKVIIPLDIDDDEPDEYDCDETSFE